MNGQRAPYWWDGLFDIESDAEGTGDTNGDDPDHEKFDSFEVPEGEEIVRTARRLWGGWRDIEGYAFETFPVEERLNGMTWMQSD